MIRPVLSPLRTFRLLAVLLVPMVLLAQKTKQKQPDSLYTYFLSIPPTDTLQLLKTGKQILQKPTTDQRQFEVLEKISEMYFRADNINQSIAYAFKAKDIAEKSRNPEMMAQAYGSIANQYSYLNLGDKARNYLSLAIAQIDRLPAGDKKFRLKALSFLELGKLDFNNDDYGGANKNFRLSLQQFNRLESRDKNSNYHYRRALYNIGNSYYYLKQPDSASFYLDKALAVKDRENPDLKYFIYSTLAEVYTMRGQYKRAIDTLQTVLKDRNFRISPLKAEIYLNLSKNYKQVGDKANYTHYNEMHLSLRDSVDGHERKAINTAFKVEQKGFSDSIVASQQHVQWLVYSIVLLIVVSAGVIVYLFRKKKREHAIYLSIIEKLQNQADISQHSAEPEPENDTRSAPPVPQQATDEILSGLEQFELEEGFRNPKLTVGMLAVQLDTNPAYLSSVIKTHKDKNFNTYINELRIGYICRQIHAKREYVHYKISFLAEDCGFVSHSAFSTIFKKVTGISPSVFLSEEEKHHSQSAAHTS